MLVEANWNRESSTTSTRTTSVRRPGRGRRGADASAPASGATDSHAIGRVAPPSGRPPADGPGPSDPWSAARPLPALADLHRDLDRRPVEAEALAQLALQETPVAGLEEAGGEDDEPRRAGGGLRPAI